MSGGRLRAWALTVPAAALVAGSAGVVVRPWAVLVILGMAGLVLVAGLVRGVRWPAPLSGLGGLLLWAAADALLRRTSPQAAAAALAVGLVALVLVLAAQDVRLRLGAHPALVLAAVMAAAWLIAERLLSVGRPGGPFVNPNLAATVAALGLAAVPGLAVPAAAQVVTAVVLLAGILASASRAAMVAAGGIGLVWALARGGRRFRFTVTSLALLALAGLALRLAGDRDPLRFERVRIWAVAARTTLAELPFGAGPGGYYDAALPHNFPRDGEFARYHRVPGSPENEVLAVAAVLGLPGILLGFGLAWTAGRALARRGPVGWGVAMALGLTSLFHAHLAFPAVAWPAALAVSGCGRPFPGRRVRLPLAAAATLAAALLVPAAVALGVAGNGPADPAVLPSAAARLSGQTMRSDVLLADVEAVLWRTCALRPRAAHAWRALGAVRLQRGELRNDPALVATALDAFTRARAADPLDALAGFGAARAHRLLGHDAAALEALAGTVALEPNFVSAWLELARLQVERGDLIAAARALKRAERALALARTARFVSDYERTLAAADPVLLRALRGTVGGW